VSGVRNSGIEGFRNLGIKGIAQIFFIKFSNLPILGLLFSDFRLLKPET
jgi:hypothetical protein